MQLRQKIVIEPDSGNANYWKDLWNFRGLFYFLAWRDILVRYKQTVIGVAWSVIRPLLTVFAFTFIGWFFNIGSPGPSRLLLVATATLPWQFFSSALSDISNSLVSNSNLISKVYFPRLIIPSSTVIVCLLDFFISFLLLLILMFITGVHPDVHILMLPVFLLMAVIFAMGTGIFMAAVNVKYRDFKYIIPFIIQLGYYVSPLMFSSDSIYESTRLSPILKGIYALNPMVGVIDGFRWSLLGNSMTMHWTPFLVSSSIGFCFFFLGIVYFRKMEKYFADVI
ncbi:MAG: ABC transporter permease [Bacteroidia bacterium]